MILLVFNLFMCRKTVCLWTCVFLKFTWLSLLQSSWTILVHTCIFRVKAGTPLVLCTKRIVTRLKPSWNEVLQKSWIHLLKAQMSEGKNDLSPHVSSWMILYYTIKLLYVHKTKTNILLHQVWEKRPMPLLHGQNKICTWKSYKLKNKSWKNMTPCEVKERM